MCSRYDWSCAHFFSRLLLPMPRMVSITSTIQNGSFQLFSDYIYGFDLAVQTPLSFYSFMTTGANWSLERKLAPTDTMLRDIIIIGSGFPASLQLSPSLIILHHSYLTYESPYLSFIPYRQHPEVPQSSSPVALRHFDHLGILDELEEYGPESSRRRCSWNFFSRTGKQISYLDFSGKHGLGYGDAETGRRYKARRVMRINSSLAMIAATEKRGNIKMVFGKKFPKAEQLEDEDRIEVHFQDGSRQPVTCCWVVMVFGLQHAENS